MRTLLIGTLSILPWLAPAQAQQQASPPKSYTLTVSSEDAVRIFNKMTELPWKDVNPLIQSLMSQINTQNIPPDTAPPAPKE